MNNIINWIKEDLNYPLTSIKNTVELLSSDNTVPFIARYRKEVTGHLDEVQIKEIDKKLKYYSLLLERKKTILENITNQNKLTNTLEEQINKCRHLSALEDLYLPYKQKKQTRANIAKEKGLEPLAEIVMNEKNPLEKAVLFINKEKKVFSVEEALQGASDIVAEKVAEDFEIRQFMKKYCFQEAFIITKEKTMPENSDFEMYKDFKEKIISIKPHRILAINRAEKLGEITVKLDFSNDIILDNIKKYFIIHFNDYLLKAIEDGYKRLLKPSIEREIRAVLSEKAEIQAIHIFTQNLENLLLQPPIKEQIILGIDPGIRTGCKYCVIGKQSEFLSYGTFFQKNISESLEELFTAIQKYNVQLIAIGNGTGSKDVEKIVAHLIQSKSLSIKYAVVPETGASIYSASDTAREEFPNLDLTIRGAISIGRRLQDPLSEYVKIDPQSLGVGQYQHDMNQTLLKEELTSTVQSIVNRVGVNLNSASYELLRYVSGFTPSLAKKVVLFRQLNGRFTSRTELKKISGLGEKIFQQSAGFLKIPQAKNPLDNTWVHPEQYPIAEKLLGFKILNSPEIRISSDQRQSLMKEFNIDKTTINTIIQDLQKPNLDPRDDIETPLLKEEILTIEMLQKGMILKGTVRNVVDFGAFIDIGVKNDGLVHISEIANQFLKHPSEALQLGNIVDVMVIGIDKERQRVQLSIKQASKKHSLNG